MRPSLRRLCGALALGTLAGTAGAEEPEAHKPKPDFTAEIEANKSYGIPAAEIAGFQFLLNQFDRRVYGAEYRSDWSSIKRNLRSKWVTDNDPFEINQFYHPYAGSMYFGFARSAGLSFWESLGYSFAGSATWEIAGEVTPPSRNDQISTGIGGAFLGESLYRISSLVLEQGDGPNFWRELTAAALAPSAAFNRLTMRERFGRVMASHSPVYYSRTQVGTSVSTQSEAADQTAPKRGELLADFAMEYGLPGKPGYKYDRPFDYFSFQATGSSANGVETLATRGLLLGTDYEVGDRYRGIWGLYGSYDYFAPQLFRISSTALSLGTTAQFNVSESIALQGNLAAGLGYAGVGTVHGTNDLAYHYGVAPQALATLRLILGKEYSLDFTARDYFVSGVAGSSTGGHDNIARADVTFTWRIRKQHAVALKYQWSRRDATFASTGDIAQTRATIGVYYTILGHDAFGAVDWR